MQDEEYKQDDDYIYASPSNDGDLIGLATTLVIFIIGFILYKLF